MLKRLFVSFSLMSFLLFLSCDSHEKEPASVYCVVHKDFEDYIVVDGSVEPVRSTTLTCPRYVEGVIAFILEDGSLVEKGDTVAVIEVQQLQTEYDQQQISLENARAGLNKTKAQLLMEYALLEAEVRNNEANAIIASLDSLQLKYSPENQRKISELELQKVNIEKNKIGKKLKALAVIQQSEVRKLELEIQRLENRVKSLKEQLDELILRAPKKGLATRGINFMTNTKIQLGDPVWGGMPVANIPEMDEMKVKISASERDYKYMNVKDSVSYTFDAMPGNVAWGKITSKSPVGQQHKQDSKVKFFEIEASIDSCLTLPELGFTANCRISLRRVADTIVVPQIAVFEEDSMKVVYVKKAKGYEKRQVRLGLSSPKEAVVASGLDANESVALSKPQASRVKETTLLPDSIKQKPNN